MVTRMPDQPAPQPVPVTPTPDDTAADLGTLEDMGVVDPQPTPSPEPPPPPTQTLDAPDEPPAE